MVKQKPQEKKQIGKPRPLSDDECDGPPDQMVVPEQVVAQPGVSAVADGGDQEEVKQQPCVPIPTQNSQLNVATAAMEVQASLENLNLAAQ